MLHPLAVLAWLVAPPPDPVALARDLGSPLFAVRERAERELWKLGRAARPAVAAAAVGPDPEVRIRSAAVLERFDWGLYPDTPADVRKLIDQFRGGDPDRQNKAIDELLLLNDRGLDALVAILARDFLPDRQKSIFRHLALQIRRSLPGDLLAGRFDRAERLLEAAALGGDPDAWADYAVLMRLRGRLPAAAEVMRRYGDRPGPRGESATTARAWAEVLAGRPADAVRTLDKLADRSAAPDPDWPTAAASAREEAGDWAGLAAGGPPHPLALFRLQLAGDRPAADRMAKALTAHPPADDVEDIAPALFLCRRPAVGLELLAKHPRVRADLRTDVLAARGEFAAALQLTVPPRDVDPEPPADIATAFPTRRGRLLAQVGRTDEADRQFAAVADGIRRLDTNGVWSAAVGLLRAEMRSNRIDIAAAHAARFLEQMDKLGQGHDHSPSPFELLFEDDAEAARGWWTALRQHGPKEEPADSMARVRELLAGTASADRRAATDAAIQRWHDAIHRSDYPNPDLRMRLALARAAAARAAGDLGTAEKQLALAAAAAGQAKDDADDPEGGPRGWVYGTDERFRASLDHGDLLTDLGRPADAAAAYLDGWRRFPDNPILLYLSGRALLAAGQTEEGERRIERSHWVPLGNARMRGRFLEELCSRGRRADLRRERDLTRACVWCWAEQHGNVWNQVQRASALLDDFDAAAAAGDRLLHYILRTNQIADSRGTRNGRVSFVDGSAYANMPMHGVLFRARAKLAAGDADAAVRLASEYLDALPVAVEPLLGLLPELDARGRSADADALFRRVWAAFDRLTTEYPASAWARTSAALLAAGGRRELDAGLAHARRAVELDPQSRAAKEALAEVRFRRGERAEAVRLMQELAKAEPRSRFYRRQLERYRSGDVGSRLPLGPEG